MSKPVTPASYIEKAERALNEARLLLKEKATEGACRAYYAMLDAAHAVLIATGHEKPDAVIKTVAQQSSGYPPACRLFL